MPLIKKNKKREIKVINYFYVVLLFAGSILLTLYIFKYYNNKLDEKLSKSYLVTSNTIDNVIEDIDTLEQVLDEAPTSYFLYLSYTGDESVYEFETHLKKYIDDYKLNDIFYYVDFTDLKNNNKDYLKEIKEMFELSHLYRLPAIIYIHDNELNDADILDGRYGTTVTMMEIQELLNYYKFEKIK